VRRRALRFLRLAVASPASAWLLIRMLAWRFSFMVLKRVLPLKTVVRLAEPRRRRATVDSAEQERVEFLASRLVRTDDCLERSLVAYRFLSRAGARPQLFLGFARDSARREGHAWVEVESRPLLESRATLDRFVPVAQFPSPQ